MIDLSPIGGVVSTLQESKIECLSADKVGSLLLHIEMQKVNLDPGCLLVLFSITLPRSITCLPILDRWNSKTLTVDGAAEYQGFSAAFTARATATSKEP